MVTALRCGRIVGLIALLVTSSALAESSAERAIKSAEKGNVEDQYLIGTHYRYGEANKLDDGSHLEKNLSKSHYWLLKAAEAGNFWAQYELGDMLLSESMDNPFEGIRWLERSIQSGSKLANGADEALKNDVNYQIREAQYLLGDAYYQECDPHYISILPCNRERKSTGLGVFQDHTQARLWFQRAAQSGHKDAAYQLGTIYEIGRGVPQDYAMAARWYQLAAEKLNRSAFIPLAKLSQKMGDLVSAHMWFNLAGEFSRESRDAVEKVMKSSDVMLAQRRASEWAHRFGYIP